MPLTLSRLTPAQSEVRDQRLRCQRLLDSIRICTARLAHAGWDAPTIQAAGGSLSLLFRLSLANARIIRRPSACADLRMSAAEAARQLASARGWLLLARADFRAAVAAMRAQRETRDPELLHAAQIIVEAAAVMAGLAAPVPMAYTPAERLLHAGAVFHSRAKREDWPEIYAVLDAYGEGDDAALNAAISPARAALHFSPAERAMALLARDGERPLSIAAE